LSPIHPSLPCTTLSRSLPAFDTLDHHGGGTRAYLRARRRGLRGVIAVGPVGGVLDVDEHRAVVRGEGEAGNFTAIGADEEAPQLPLGLHIERRLSSLLIHQVGRNQ